MQIFFTRCVRTQNAQNCVGNSNVHVKHEREISPLTLPTQHSKSGWGKSLRRGLLDQAQARVPYRPRFGGQSCSIPQVVVSDVPPLVKSSFWDRK